MSPWHPGSACARRSLCSSPGARAQGGCTRGLSVLGRADNDRWWRYGCLSGTLHAALAVSRPSWTAELHRDVRARLHVSGADGPKKKRWAALDVPQNTRRDLADNASSRVSLACAASMGAVHQITSKARRSRDSQPGSAARPARLVGACHPRYRAHCAPLIHSCVALIYSCVAVCHLPVDSSLPGVKGWCVKADAPSGVGCGVWL